LLPGSRTATAARLTPRAAPSPATLPLPARTRPERRSGRPVEVSRSNQAR
jgi:hypothetical protein